MPCRTVHVSSFPLGHMMDRQAGIWAQTSLESSSDRGTSSSPANSLHDVALCCSHTIGSAAGTTPGGGDDDTDVHTRRHVVNTIPP